MFGQGFNLGFFGEPPCFTDTTDIFKDNSGVALYTLDYDASAAPIPPGTIVEGASLKMHLNATNSSSYNGSGSTWADLTSNNYDATLVSSPSYNSNNGGYLDFDGSADYGSFSSTAASDFQNDTYGSIEVWVYGDTWSGGNSRKTIFGTGHSSSIASWSVLRITPTNGIQWSNWNGSTDRGFRTGVAPPTGEWLHIVVTTTADGVGKIYLNGVSQTLIYGNGSAGDGSVRWFSHVSSNTLQVGAMDRGSYGNNYDPFNGRIAQVRYYTNTLTDAEVLQNYSATRYNYVNYDGTPTDVDFGVGGKSLYGARFNGSSSRINTGLIWSGGTEISCSLWINTAGGVNQYLFGGFDDGGSNASNRLAFQFHNSNVLYILTNGAGGGLGTTTNAGSIANYLNKWTHIVVTVSGTTVKAYLDGSLFHTSTGTALAAGSYPFIIGAYTDNSSRQNVNGKIDQVRIFNKAISASEVSKLYNNGAGEIACEHTATTTDVNYPVTNLAYYKLDNSSKDSGKSRGKFNQGATFIGNSAGIVNTTLQLSSTAHSVSLWMKPQDLTATKWQIMFFSAFNGHPSFTLGKRPDKTTAFHYRNESSNEVYFTLSNANTWYHVVVTRNNSGSTVYVNGSSVATDSNSMGSYGSSAYEKASIGSNPNYPAEYFDGTLDQIRVYNVALTATDVANLYNNETTTTAGTLAFPTGKTAIATYKLDGDGVDISGNYSGSEGNNIVYGYDGSDTNVEYTFGKYGQAAVFNGTSSYIDLPRELADVWRAAGAFSTSLWFKRDGNQTDTTYGGRILHILDDIYIRIDIQTNNTIKALVVQPGPVYPETVSNVIPDGVWQHIVFTGDSNSIKLYLNGVLVDSDSWNGAFITYTNTNYKFNRLGYSGSGISYMKGQIDQVRFFTSALSAENVTKLYNEKPEIITPDFNIALYSGTNTTQYISNIGIDLETSGGLVWVKNRTGTNSNALIDSVRGRGSYLYSDTNTIQSGASGTTNDLISFEKNGFFAGSTSQAGSVNTSGGSIVAWVWKGGGLLNKSASFNGSNSRITLHNTAFKLTTYTISHWIYSTNYNQSGVGTYDGGLDQTGGSWKGFSIIVNSNKISSYGGNNGGFYTGPNSTTTLVNGTWYHVAFVIDGTSIKGYINGVHDTALNKTLTAPMQYSSTSTNVFHFGVRSGNFGSYGYFNGFIDQARIFNTALSDANIATLYNETASTINTLQILGDTSCIATYPLGVGAGDVGNTYSGTSSNVTFNNPGHLTRNTSGTIESMVSANQDAGFSIVKYTGVTGGTQNNVGHGLNSAPEIIFQKKLTSGTNWYVIYTVGDGSVDYLNLNGTAAKADMSGAYSNFQLGSNTFSNWWDAGEIVNYCWHSVAGYSKIGSFTGDGTSDKFITVGFKPSWVILKNTENTYRWYILDSRRDPSNPAFKRLFANDNAVEATNSNILNFESTGFRLITSDAEVNQLNKKILYMAFK